MIRSSPRRSRYAALILLGLGVAFYLTFAIGEMAGGDVGGVQHLPPVALLAGLLLVAVRRPGIAGRILLALALPLGTLYIVLLVVRGLPPTWALVVVLPPVITGWLLTRSDSRGRR